jgi:hypothetical protein
MDWAAWSRESVTLMSQRTRDLIARHELGADTDYHWNIESATMTIGPLKLRLVVVGTVSTAEDSFVWSWANETIPKQAKLGIEKVGDFGEENDLKLLTEPMHGGGKATGEECLAVAARILDASAIWIDTTAHGYIFLALFETA